MKDSNYETTRSDTKGRLGDFVFRFVFVRLISWLKTACASSLRHRRLLIVLSLLILVAAFCGAWRVREGARAQLERERARLARASVVSFELRPRPALNRPELQIWQDTRRVRAVARFHDAYFAATDGGLLELSQTGALLRHYTTLDGLPESDLTALATWQGRLYIGTRTQGLADFDGAQFRSYAWPDRKPQAITTLVADSTSLLIGTFAGGLLEFDGRQFRERKDNADKSLLAINCLARDDSARLYVGTFADGLWLADAGRWLHFTTDAGLPSNRIVGVVADDERLYVATDFGLAFAAVNSLLTAQQGPAKFFQTIATLPSLAGLARFDARLWLSQDDGRLYTLDLNQRRAPQLATFAWGESKDSNTGLSDCRLLALDEELWLLTSDGIRRTNVNATDASSDATNTTRATFALKPFMLANAPRELAGNTTTALALDNTGRLWAGSFRDGIALLAADGRRLKQLDTDAAREINALAFEPNTNTMLAATSQGLARFDATLHATRLTTADGLLSNAVTHVALWPAQPTQTNDARASSINAAHHAGDASLVCATGRGLSLNAGGRWRGLTSAQGLPSNSLYALLPHGRSIFVGTLGGLAEVEQGRVARIFTDANSKLTHNWVTALTSTGERMFVGTYGGGVFELLPSNELRPFAAETGALTVNPNAMWSDGARLYVGATNGAWVFDLRAQRWTRLQAELPAPMVLSVTGDGRYVYFGTTNGIARVSVSYFEQQ